MVGDHPKSCAMGMMATLILTLSRLQIIKERDVAKTSWYLRGIDCHQVGVWFEMMRSCSRSGVLVAND